MEACSKYAALLGQFLAQDGSDKRENHGLRCVNLVTLILFTFIFRRSGHKLSS
jgi:hypothetical protein